MCSAFRKSGQEVPAQALKVDSGPAWQGTHGSWGAGALSRNGGKASEWTLPLRPLNFLPNEEGSRARLSVIGPFLPSFKGQFIINQVILCNLETRDPETTLFPQVELTQKLSRVFPREAIVLS